MTVIVSLYSRHIFKCSWQQRYYQRETCSPFTFGILINKQGKFQTNLWQGIHFSFPIMILFIFTIVTYPLIYWVALYVLRYTALQECNRRCTNFIIICMTSGTIARDNMYVGLLSIYWVYNIEYTRIVLWFLNVLKVSNFPPFCLFGFFFI